MSCCSDRRELSPRLSTSEIWKPRSWNIGLLGVTWLVASLFAVDTADAGVVNAVIGAAKQATISGREVTFDLYLESLDTGTLTNVSLVEDLDTVFGAGNYTMTSSPIFIDDPGTLTLDPSFDGSTTTEIISSGTLAGGDTAQIRLVVEIDVISDQGMGAGVYSNQVIAAADGTSDLSDSGTDPDPNGNGDPTEMGEDDPTVIDITASPRVGVAKNVSLLGTLATVDLYLENLGNRLLNSVSVTDDLDLVLGAGNYNISSPPTLIDDPGTLTLNGSFDGSGDDELIASGSLAVADTAQIRFVVDITTVSDQGLGFGVYSNQVTAAAQGATGGMVSDLSDAGTNPDPNGNGAPNDPDEDDPTLFVVGEEPVLGVAKDASVSASDVTLDFYLENLGNVELEAVSLGEDLDAVFGAMNYSVTSGPVLIDDPGTLLVNGSFDGSSDLALVASGTLAAGATAQIRVEVKIIRLVDLGSGLGNYSNQVTASAMTSSGTPASDLSDDGTDPDPNGNGDPTEAGENDPTPISVSEIPVLGVAKRVVVLPSTAASVDVGGVHSVQAGPRVSMFLYLENLGNVELSSLSLVDELDSVFGAGNYGTFVNSGSFPHPEILEDTGGGLVRNTNYNGSTDTEVLAPGSTMGPGDSATIRIDALVITLSDQGSGIGVYANQATASGEGPSAGMTTDLSDSGTDPDPNDNGDPTDAGEDDPTEFVVGSTLGVAKAASVAGSEVTFDLYLETFGATTLSDVSVQDSLDSVFGSGNYSVTTAPFFVDDPGTLVLEPSFDGSTVTELLAAGSSLSGGDTAQIQFVVTVTELINPGFGFGLGNYSNQASVGAAQPGGTTVGDLSDAGTDPDPNGNDDPREAGENDPTTFSITTDAVVGVAKDITLNGTEVTIDLYLENLGTETSTDLSLVDDLDMVFGAGNYTLSTGPTLIVDPGTLVLDGAYDGSGSVEMLVASSSLAAGATAQIQLIVDVTQVEDQGLGLGIYSNQATVVGTDSTGLIVSDLSDDGTDPDPDGDGDPTEPGLANPPSPGENDPSLFFLGDASIGAALHSFVNGTQITLDYYLENLGDVEATDLSVSHNLFLVFGFGNYAVVSSPVVMEGPATLSVNASFDGTFNTFLVFDGSLQPGEKTRIRLVLNVTNVSNQGDGFGVYPTGFAVTGQDPLGDVLTDTSDDGILTDPNGNGVADEAGENDETLSIIGEESILGAAKSATLNGTEVTFDLYLENFGNVLLSDLSLGEDLDEVFGAGNYSVTTSPAWIDDPGTATLNPVWDGSSTTELFFVGSSLGAGDTAQLQIVVDVTTLSDQGMGLGVYSNQVLASGIGPNATVAQDLSDAGADPDPNGTGNPADIGEGDPTVFSIDTASIGAAKRVFEVVGREVTFEFAVENLGPSGLLAVSLTDDLDATLGAGNYAITSPPALVGVQHALDANSGFNGSSDTVIASGTLAPGLTERFRFTVLVTTVTDQGFGLGTYSNQASVSAMSAGGAMTSDLSEDGTDPDPNGNGDPTEAGEDDPTILTLQPSVSGSVWNDLNGDGIRDGGEPTLSGVDVFIDLNTNGLRDGGEPFATSGLMGAYSIISPVSGSVTVRVDTSTAPTGFVATSTNPLMLSLFPGEQRMGVDFGFQQQDASIGDFVWNDLNGDGILDGGEPGLPGITVYLDLNTNGVLDGGEPFDTTIGSGSYDITDLATGSYSVRVDASSLPAGFNLTSSNLPLSVPLATGEDFNSADFGYQQQDASIGDFVWNDLDGDGVQDAGEPGLAGIVVYLDLNTNGVLDGGEPFDTSDGLGDYDIENLATGTYSVRVDPTTVPTGFVLTGGTVPLSVILPAGDNYDFADFGYQQQDATIGDFVWSDENADGVQDGGEPGLPGVVVYLDLNTNGVLDGGEPSDTTGAGGDYDIVDLATGTYEVRVDSTTIPAGFLLTTANIPLVVNLAAGENFDSADFGYQGTFDLSIVKTDSVDPVAPSAPLIYTIEVTNAGPSAAASVEVTETLPVGVTFVATTGCANDPVGVPVCELGDLAVGAMAQYTVEVMVNSNVGAGPITNSVTVSASGAEIMPGNNDTSEDTSIDDSAPTVESVDSNASTTDGEVTECEEVRVRVDELLISFSEALYDPAGDTDPEDVTNPGNYLLVAAGADRDISTTSCSGAMGDDIQVAVDGVTFNSNTNTATLSVNGGVPLGNSPHRLFACGSGALRDEAGNDLDGDDDGSSGGDFVLGYRIERNNRFINGSFDCDLQAWTAVSTLPEEVAYGSDDVDAATVSGSAEVVNLSASTDFSLGQCIDLNPSLSCTFDLRQRVEIAAPQILNSTQICQYFSQAGCTGGSLGTSINTSVVGNTGGVWISQQLATGSPLGTASAMCAVSLRTANGSSFDANVDSMRLTCTGPIFADGFESGTTSAWSVVSP
ncbi:MAG: DUF11 domain-containing protein [Thermoanaerobaculia bacterium]|nr:DUF11 domain-containing protein [Thermoanaerobaculia bacterium]